MSFKDHDLEHNPTDLLEDTYRYTIMIVDDSSMARKLIKNHAKEINASIVCEASNAEEAYAKYVEFEPDVVTMDVSMPGQSGLEAVKKIIHFDPNAKILMITSHGEEATVIDALESGARGFILKPVTKEKLEEQFHKVKHDKYKMFSSVHYFKDLGEKSLKELKKFTVRSDYLIFLAEKSQDFFHTVRDLAFDSVGGIFPELIFNGEVYSEGMLIFELSREANYKFVEHMKDPLDESMNEILQNKKTIVSLADATSPNVEEFLQKLSSVMNSDTTVIGCGAGVKGMKRKASIFTPKGIYQDAALIIYSHEPMKLGDSHSFEILSNGYEIKKAYGSTLVEVGENKQAFNLYKNVLSSKKSLVLEDNNFFDLIKQFPIGVRLGEKIMIKDILRRNTNGLCTMSNFHMGDTMYFMQWDEIKSQNSAKEAVLEAIQDIEASKRRFAFIFEGVERREYYDNDDLIKHDLLSIQEELHKIPQCGAVSLMEFSNKSSSHIEILNNSILIGLIY